MSPKFMLWIFLNNSEEKKDPSIQYLSGHSPSFCLLVYDAQTRRKCMFVAGFEVGTYKGIKTFAFNEKQLRPTILKYFKIKKLSYIGINYPFISLRETSFFKKTLKVKYEDISKNIIKLRIIKSEQELKKIKKACELTDKLFKDIVLHSKNNKFRTETDISKFILRWAIDRTVDHSFSPIVASGKNAASPHHQAGNFPLKGFTVLDFGIKYAGYCSDMSRTLFFGKPAKDDERLYNELLNLQIDCINAVKPGVMALKVDEIARSKIRKYFTHSLGHGVGVQIHEAPGIGPKSKSKFQEGMIITIEPGYYKSGSDAVGMRIEDTLVISKNKAITLTKSNKKLIMIP